MARTWRMSSNTMATQQDAPPRHAESGDALSFPQEKGAARIMRQDDCGV